MKKNQKNQNKSALQSMTGFGEATLNISKPVPIILTCKIKSYNHRFLETKIKFPKSEIFDLDLQIKKIIQNNFERGAFDLALTIQNPNSKTESQNNLEVLNLDWLTQFSKEIKKKNFQIKKLGFSNSKISLETALNLQKDIKNNSDDLQHTPLIDPDQFITLVKDVAELAIEKLKLDRTREGFVLSKHLCDLLSEIRVNLVEIKKNEPIEKTKSIEALKSRIKKTLDYLNLKQNTSQTNSLDFEKRLQEEASIWIEKRDFEEEVIRFEAHLNHFEKLLNPETQTNEKSIGKLLEFKHQELLREINTLGNKAQSIEISSYSVKIKTLIEKMREQIANVE